MKSASLVVSVSVFVGSILVAGGAAHAAAYGESEEVPPPPPELDEPQPPPVAVPAPVAESPQPPVVVVQAPAPAPPPRRLRREGFTIGFALGPGRMADESEAHGGAGVSFRAGGALSPSVLLQGELAATAISLDGVTMSLSWTGASVTGYVTPRFYLSGGLGFSQLAASIDGERLDESEPAAGVMVGLGVEVYQGQAFGVAVESRGYAASFDGESISAGNVMVAFQWF